MKTEKKIFVSDILKSSSIGMIEQISISQRFLPQKPQTNLKQIRKATLHRTWIEPKNIQPIENLNELFEVFFQWRQTLKETGLLADIPEEACRHCGRLSDTFISLIFPNFKDSIFLPEKIILKIFRHFFFKTIL